MEDATRTCTIQNATTGLCGKPAVYVEGKFAECEEHAAEHGSLYNTRHMLTPDASNYRVGDKVSIHRYGLVYEGTVVYVGKRGRVEAEFTYNNGTTRRVKI